MLCGKDLVGFSGQAHLGEEAAGQPGDFRAEAAGRLDDRGLGDCRRESRVPVQVPRVGGEVALQEDRHLGQVSEESHAPAW